MYYLTEDNKIDNEIKNPYAKIKKQSENVFDLIEVEDLVGFEYKNDTIDIVKVRSVDIDLQDGINILSRGYRHDLNKIVAIYKPNKNGDYIKVWERE